MRVSTQLGVDAKAGAGAAQGVGEHVSGTELLADLRRGNLLIPEGKNGRARKDVQSPNLGELLGDAVAQVFVLLGIA